MYRYQHKVVAHRCGGTVAPENTLMAVQAGHLLGYSAVEFDVMLSSDKLPILMHDEGLGRTVSGSGRICDLTRAELTRMDASKWHSSAGCAPIGSGHTWTQSGNVPLFDDVLKFCKDNHIWMNVEIKPSSGQEVETGTIVAQYVSSSFASELNNFSEMLATYNYSAISSSLAALPLISSFSYESLLAAKLAAPMIPRAFLIDDLNSEESKDWRQQLCQIGAVAVHTNHKYLTQELAQEIKNMGYALFCYTVNTEEECLRVQSLGVDSVCTDTLDSLHNQQLLCSKA